MAGIDTDFLQRSIAELRRFLEELERHEPGEFFYGLSGAECVKEFELAHEESESLLRRRLGPHLTSAEEANSLAFGELIRYSAKVGLIPLDAAERRLEYHSLRNDAAHLCEGELAGTTLKTLRRFIEDAGDLAEVIGEDFDE